MYRTMSPLRRTCLSVLTLLFLGLAFAASAKADDQKAPLSAQAVGSDCPQRPDPNVGTPSKLIVELAPDTPWRPRGTEVRFSVRGTNDTAGVRNVRICFGWQAPIAPAKSNGSATPAASPNSVPSTNPTASANSTAFGAEKIPHGFYDLHGAPLVRSIYDGTGIPQYGAVVPDLDEIPGSDWWLRRFVGPNVVSFAGLDIAPVADMVVEVTTGNNEVVTVSLPVGITSVTLSWAIVAIVFVAFWWAVSRVAPQRNVPARQLALRVISTGDGYASLSQFQIMLWAIVVGLSAVYVMVLSGNLISVTPGTLTLLGIASVAALLGRLPPTDPAAGVTRPAVTGDRSPRWSDLVITDSGTGEIDVTRVQMLIFTLISAAFVTLKVVSSYEIPTIPDTFLLLMGISNGVYVTGRHIPSRGRST